MTINGKSREDILAELRADFPENEFEDRDGHPYLSYCSYNRRIEDVVGIFNLQCDVVNTKHVKVGNSDVLLGDARFIIFDDSGKPAISRSYPCGTNVIVTAETGNCSNFSNMAEQLYQKAFSKGCKLFGIGVTQLRERRSGTKAGKPYTITVTGKFSPVGSCYKGMAAVSELNGEEREVVIFKNGITSIEKAMSMEKFMASTMGKTFIIYGKEGEYHGKKQLVLNAVSIKK